LVFGKKQGARTMGDYGPLLGGPKMQPAFVDGSPGATGSTDQVIYADRSVEVIALCWIKRNTVAAFCCRLLLNFYRYVTDYWLGG
jgi:hypothetical protein